MTKFSTILAAAAVVLLPFGVASADSAPLPVASGVALQMTLISKATPSSPAPRALEVVASMPEVPLKKCGFDSDCPHGKCSGGQCGACGFDSECKGWGKCEGGKCGACGFDSECKDFGGCSSGKCKASPYKD